MEMFMRKLRFLCTVLLMVIAAAPLFAAGADSGYKVTKRIAVGGDGGWDYLTFDQASRRLFIARATRIMVVDVDGGKLLGEIAGTNGVHGVAIAAKAGRAVASNGKDNSVLIFDLKTLAPVATVETGGKPDAILFEPLTGLVATFDGASNDVTLIDPEKGAAVGSIALPGRPETGVSDGKGKVFVNLEDKAEIAVIDIKARKVVGTWPLVGCEEPTGLAFDAANRRLFSGCHNSVLVVVDADSGKNVQKLTIGAHVDAVTFDAEKKLVFTSNGEGNVSVIRQDEADKYTSYENVPTLAGAKTIALDAEKHRLYTVANVAAANAGGKATFHVLVIEQ
jgi:DNA-binding beta-propeller fold protein YncE